MTNELAKFYVKHVQMSVYGMRCQIFEHFKIRPEDEVAEKDAELVAKLNEISVAAFDCMNNLEEVQIPEVIDSIREIDDLRMELERIASIFHERVNKVMTSEVVMRRLYEMNMEQQRRAMIEKNKAAVNPANLAGSPADLKGATTASINKDGEIKPATKQPDSAPANDKPVDNAENK